MTCVVTVYQRSISFSKEKIIYEHCKALAPSTYWERRARWFKKQAQSLAASMDSEPMIDQVVSPMSILVPGGVSFCA